MSKISHSIEYIIATHNHVVVPSLGAFVINQREAQILENGDLMPPSYNISFNSAVIHDDGLLNLIIAKANKIEYKAANDVLQKLVRELINELQIHQRVSIGNLGDLHIDEEQKILFIPNTVYRHPTIYGSSNVEIKKLAEISLLELKEEKTSSLKYTIWAGVAASVAAALLILPSTKIKDFSSTTETQTASFHTILSSLNMEKKTEIPLESSISTETNSTNVSNKYFLIIAGDNLKTRANSLLTKLQEKDFPDAEILEHNGRYRVYIDSYASIHEAEAQLIDFRNKNPKYKNSWIYSVK